MASPTVDESCPAIASKMVPVQIRSKKSEEAQDKPEDPVDVAEEWVGIALRHFQIGIDITFPARFLKD